MQTEEAWITPEGDKRFNLGAGIHRIESGDGIKKIEGKRLAGKPVIYILAYGEAILVPDIPRIIGEMEADATASAPGRERAHRTLKQVLQRRKIEIRRFEPGSKGCELSLIRLPQNGKQFRIFSEKPASDDLLSKLTEIIIDAPELTFAFCRGIYFADWSALPVQIPAAAHEKEGKIVLDLRLCEGVKSRLEDLLWRETGRILDHWLGDVSPYSCTARTEESIRIFGNGDPKTGDFINADAASGPESDFAETHLHLFRLRTEFKSQRRARDFFASGAEVEKWLDDRLLSRAFRKKIDAILTIYRDAGREHAEAYSLLMPDLLHVELGKNLLPLAGAGTGKSLGERIGSVRRLIANELGIILPSVRIRDDLRLAPDEYVIRVKEKEVGRGKVAIDHVLACGMERDLHKLGPAITSFAPYDLPGCWIPKAQREEAMRLGCMIFSPLDIITTHLSEIARTFAADLLGREELKDLLDNLKKTRPALVTDLIPAVITHADLQTVLQTLLRHRVSIRNLEVILETIEELGQVTKDPFRLAGRIRQRLTRPPDDKSLTLIRLN